MVNGSESNALNISHLLCTMTHWYFVELIIIQECILDMALPGLRPFQVWKSIWGSWKWFQLVSCKIWRRWYILWMQSFKLICEISEPSIGLYYQIKHNLELFIEKDVKTLVRVEKTLPIMLHRKPTISILYKNAKTTLKRKILFQM